MSKIHNCILQMTISQWRAAHLKIISYKNSVSSTPFAKQIIWFGQKMRVYWFCTFENVEGLNFNCLRHSDWCQWWSWQWIIKIMKIVTSTGSWHLLLFLPPVSPPPPVESRQSWNKWSISLNKNSMIFSKEVFHHHNA